MLYIFFDTKKSPYHNLIYDREIILFSLFYNNSAL